MSVSVDFYGAEDGPDGPFDLASTGSWGRFVAWAEGLSADFPRLRELAKKGETAGSDALSAELEAAGKPGDEAAAAVAAELAGVLGVGDPDETVRITD